MVADLVHGRTADSPTGSKESAQPYLQQGCQGNIESWIRAGVWCWISCNLRGMPQGCQLILHVRQKKVHGAAWGSPESPQCLIIKHQCPPLRPHYRQRSNGSTRRRNVTGGGPGDCMAKVDRPVTSLCLATSPGPTHQFTQQSAGGARKAVDMKDDPSLCL